METFDIDNEYERIFRPVHYPIIFDSMDEEYQNIRQEIMTAPRCYESVKKLPFEDIDFLIYEKVTLSNLNMDSNNIVMSIRNHVVKTITDILNVIMENTVVNG